MYAVNTAFQLQQPGWLAVVKVTVVMTTSFNAAIFVYITLMYMWCNINCKNNNIMIVMQHLCSTIEFVDTEVLGKLNR